MDLFPCFVEEFAGKAEGADAPVDHAEDVEEGGVVVVEVDGDHGHFQLLDEPDDRWLPLAVGDMQGAVYFRDGAGGEEAEGMPLAHVGHRRADAVHGDLLFLRVVAMARIDGNEARPHRRDIVEEEVDHHLEVGAVSADDVDQQDAVEGSEGMVAHHDKGFVFEPVEHFFAVDAFLDLVAVVDQKVGEGDSRGVAICAVDLIALVEYEPMHDFFDELRMAVENRGHLPYVVIIEEVRTHAFGK